MFFFFLGSTLITQIMILNLLIAILSETHGKVQADYKNSDQRQKLMLMAEYIGQVESFDKRLKKYCCCFNRFRQSKKEHKFLFMMKPVSNEAEEGAGGERSGGGDKSSRNQKGQMKRLEHVMETKFREIDNMLNKKILGALHDLD